MKLTGKQKRFVEEYLIDLNAAAAMRRAGYKSKNPDVDGHQLLVKPSIQKEVQKAMDERSKRTQITADSVLQELAHIAFDDIKNYLEFYPDEDTKYGVRINIKDSRQIDTRNVAEVSIGKDGFKFKTYCKDHALVNVGKHLGMFKDNINLNGNVGVTIIDDIGSDDDGT
ncbi:hypothetical protein BKM15_25885 [Pseudomonas syringae pv. syringae]|nr:hypothetical protein BKM15_25885 [Pseudomonas syringae pv. syringae]